MRKIAIILTSSLLLISAQSFAQRPSMDERPAATNRPAPVQVPEEESFRPAAVDVSAPEKIETKPEPIAEPAPVETQRTVMTGDALEMQSGETLPIRLLNFPRRGMTMDKVQNELGRPIDIGSAIGEPPITTWSYDDRVVYFEHSKVIHVVVSK